MESFTVSFNAVFPMFLIMAAGLLCRYIKVIPESVISPVNNIVFRLFTPVLLFNNIYSSGSSADEVPVKLLIFMPVCLLALYGATFFAVTKLEKDNTRRGALIQAIYRGNFVLLGLPIVTSIFPPEQAGVVGITATIFVPLLNILAVVTLETFRGGKVNIVRLLRGVVTNPLIVASLLGIVMLFLRVRLPVVAASAIKSLSGVTTPLALVTLGASLDFAQLRNNKKYVLWGTLGKLVFLPGLAIPLAILFGFRGISLATVMAAFAAPTAIASYPMAEQMDSDGPLAAELIISTSTFSCITLFLWLFCIKALGLM